MQVRILEHPLPPALLVHVDEYGRASYSTNKLDSQVVNMLRGLADQIEDQIPMAAR